MIRAGVFIGVDKSGNLQKLKDAAAGAQRMYDWAVAQGMTPKTHARLITDGGGESVHPDLIYKAIEAILGGAGVEQLFVYFAGHGVNTNRTEQWLLTDAPRNANAAVNVSGSVELARYCGIQHVVIISDACRVAPEGIQNQTIRGADVFPNEGAGDRAKPVDQFFACSLGKTSAEVKDPRVLAGYYSALYTNALLDALKGERPEALEALKEIGDSALYVTPDRLEDYLEVEVPRRVKAMGLQGKVHQNPDALILSRDAWLARIAAPVAGTRGGPPGLAPPPTSPPKPAPSLRGITRELVHSATTGGRMVLGDQLKMVRAARVPGAKDLAGTAEMLAVPFGPDRFESQCGIKVRGARIVEFYAPRAECELLGQGGDILRVNRLEQAAASVLVRFERDMCAVIPAIPEFVAALTFEGDELADVAYEPAANSPRWPLYKDRAAEVRGLRAVAASSSLHGRFRLDQADAGEVARQMQYAKGIDPTLAVYAAYAYYDLQATERIRDMSGYLRGDVGVTFFDLELLGRKLIDKSIGPKDAIVPFVPLLGQGWTLLKAHRVRLHGALDGIDADLQDSLWSLFGAAGWEKLRRAMKTEDVR